MAYEKPKYEGNVVVGLPVERVRAFAQALGNVSPGQSEISVGHGIGQAEDVMGVERVIGIVVVGINDVPHVFSVPEARSLIRSLEGAREHLTDNPFAQAPGLVELVKSMRESVDLAEAEERKLKDRPN